MIDANYTPEEMALLVEAAEHFHRYGHDYSGSYFTLVDTERLVATCGRLLDAYRNAEDGKEEAAPIHLRRLEGGFHLQADDAFVDLTDAGLREFLHQARYRTVPYSEDGASEIRYKCVARDDVDYKRVALITAVIAKSWPVEILRELAERGCSDEPTDERAETERAFAELARFDLGQLQEQVRRLKEGE